MVNRLRQIFLMLLWIAPLAFNPPQVFAEQSASRGFDSIEELIQLLREKSVITDNEATKFIERYRENTPARKRGVSVIKIIPEEDQKAYFDQVTKEVSEKIQQDVKKDVKKVKEDLDYMSDELLRRSRVQKKEVEDLQEKVTDEISNKLYKSSWTQRIRWGGDIRIRYQGEFFDDNNDLGFKPDLDKQELELANTTEDRKRFRYRVRLGVKAKVMKKNPEINVGEVDAVVRIATGNDDNPISTNDTFGDYLNKDGIVLDRAYLKWTYKPDLPIWGKIPKLELTAGRIPNPFFHTDLVWDGDLNFEGAALKIKTDTLMANPWKGFLTLGGFPLQEVELSQHDKWLFGGQVGIEYNKTMGLSGKLGLAYYGYRHIEGIQNDPFSSLMDFTAPQFYQNSNLVFDIRDPLDVDPTTFLPGLVNDFNLLNITGQLDYDFWFPLHIVLTVDYVKNLAYDKDRVLRLTGADLDADKGYQIGMLVGYPKVQGWGQWNMGLRYKYLEADAVLDAFTDSDFHLGGTNAKGWILEGQLGLSKRLWLSARWLTADEIEGDRLSIDVLQLDLNARY